MFHLVKDLAYYVKIEAININDCQVVRIMPVISYHGFSNVLRRRMILINY